MFAELDNALQKCLDGTATSEEQQFVINACETNGHVRSQVLAAVEMDATLRAVHTAPDAFAQRAIDRITHAGEEDRFAREMRRRVRPRKRRTPVRTAPRRRARVAPVLWTAAALLFVSGTIFAVIMLRNRQIVAPSPVATQVTSGATSNGDAIKASTRLPGGRQIQGELVAVYDDGSSLHTETDTVFSIDPTANKQIQLRSGSITFDVTQQPIDEPLIVHTPNASATVVGTRFRLSVTANQTRIDVTEGRVRFQRRADGASVDVDADHYAVARPGAPLATRRRVEYTEPKPEDFLADTFEANGKVLPYRLFKPRDYDPARPYPLVLFLHGAGERGTDNQKQLSKNGNGSFSFISAKRQQRDPCFFLAPQCTSIGGAQWNKSQFYLIDKTLDKLIREYSIDPRRLYITGLSSGGYGTWDLIIQYPRFAAAAPMAGGMPKGGYPGKGYIIKDIEVWNWHGAKDKVIGVTASHRAINSFRTQGLSIIYTELPDAGHEETWRTAYADERFLDWVFTQRLGQPDPAGPAITINAPATGLKYETRDPSVTIRGTTDLKGVEIVGMYWMRNHSTLKEFVGGSEWQVTIPVDRGENRIVIIAKGDNHTSINDTIHVIRR